MIVNLGEATLGARTTGYVDIYISSRDGLPLNIAGFDFTFAIVDISPIAAPASGEVFFLDSFDPARPLDGQRQSNMEQTLPDYVFRNQTTIDNFAAVRQNPTISQLAIGDSTFNIDDFSYRNIPVTTPRLLARLELGQRQSIDTVLERGSYELRIVSGSMYDADLSSVPYSINGPGSIIVSAVPEPGLICLGWLLPLLLRKRLLRKRLAWF